MDSLYNRELSWLAFNRRVLQEAEDPGVPLMQRLRFLGIYSNNNDEFIKVRFADLVRMAQSGKVKNAVLSGGYTPNELLRLVDHEVRAAQQLFTSIYKRILGEMADKGIHVLDETMLNWEQRQFCRRYFLDVVSPGIVPLFLRKTLQVPFLPDTEIYHAVCMQSGDARKTLYAILRIPVNNGCPRFIQLPSSADKQSIIFLDDIIRICLDDIFFMFNYERIRAFTFKLVRDASLSLDDDPYKSFLEKMEAGLEQRMRGKLVRLIYDQEMPEELLRTLISRLKLKQSTLEPGRRYHMMRDLMKFPVVRRDLEARRAPALQHPKLTPFSSIFRKVDRRDILLAFPYQSFNHVIDFLREAAISPKVKSIHITLYRLAADSKIVTALVSAAQNGKKVVAYVELFARFNEQHNVSVIDTLQEAGVQVIHSSPALKIHSKLILVQTHDHKNASKHYVYIGTGNFNEDTAKVYSDIGIMTTNEAFIDDARSIFLFLNNMHHRFSCKRLCVSPYNLRKSFVKLIEREIDAAKKGKKAYIWIKCNSLTDEKISRLLYKASQHGVQIRLIVRGACCVRPQVPGLSENIRAISIVDNYLEHARIMFFGNKGDEAVYISSADLMTRNLDRRVEIAAPVLDKRLRESLRHFFETQWSDTVKARDIAFLGENRYVAAVGATAVRAQAALYEFYANHAPEADL
ncbi:MAG: polyphosphate kinase 1 [Deltaproteobacteria bacterium]|nr:polyphosphate kinase 1 [Deltaproteobacteria bacterium]